MYILIINLCKLFWIATPAECKLTNTIEWLLQTISKQYWQVWCLYLIFIIVTNLAAVSNPTIKLNNPLTLLLLRILVSHTHIGCFYLYLKWLSIIIISVYIYYLCYYIGTNIVCVFSFYRLNMLQCFLVLVLLYSDDRFY